MKLTVPAPRARFSQLTQTLSLAIQHLHNQLSALPAPEAAAAAQQVHTVLSQLLAVQTLTLFDEEYVNFCDLIVCGSQMAEHILALNKASRTLRKHARYWQKTVKQLKPFLRGVLAQYTAS